VRRSLALRERVVRSTGALRRLSLSLIVMQQPGTSNFNTKLSASPAWEGTFMGFVIILAVVLLVTVVGRAALMATVYWVYGSAGYASGIRVYFVGKEKWFTNGERVPDALATAGSVGAFFTSLLLAYIIAYSVRYVYRLTRKGNHENA